MIQITELNGNIYIINRLDVKRQILYPISRPKNNLMVAQWVAKHKRIEDEDIVFVR